MAPVSADYRRWGSVSCHMLAGFIVELVLVTGLARWLWDWSWPASALLAMGVVLALRIGVVLLSFLLAWWWRTPRPRSARLRAGGVVRLLAQELWSGVRLFFVLHPFAPLLTQPDPPAELRQGAAVLLVHGFFSNGGFWWSIKRWLRRRGVCNLYTVDLSPPFADLDELARQLARRIESIRVLNSNRQVMLVAHSMGGLVARAYLRDHGTAAVACLLTLASPHQGTRPARLLPGRNLRQMCPGSDWLRALQRHEQLAPQVPAVSVYSHHDNIVAPQDNARLAWARAVPLKGLGHLAMAFAPAIKELILAQIMQVQENPNGADEYPVADTPPLDKRNG